MDKLAIPDKITPFIAALRELIRTGAAAYPNLEASCLIDLPVVRQQSGVDASATKRAHVFTQILQHIIGHRLQGKDIQVATILFSFDSYAGVPIQDRYRAVAKLHNPHWTWENYRKEPLTRHLLAVYLALEREVELTTTPAHFEIHSHQSHNGLVGQDWVMERFEGTYNLPLVPGEPLEVIGVRRLRAVSEQAGMWRYILHLREGSVQGTPLVTLIGSGTVVINDLYIDSGTGIHTYTVDVVFPQPFRYGETVEFTLIIRALVRYEILMPKKGVDWYGLVKLRSPTQSARIGVRFPLDKQPRNVWRYEDLISGLVRPGTPTDETRLTIDQSGYVSCSWADLSAGYSYGISLEW